jgi:hypothetical protein
MYIYILRCGNVSNLLSRSGHGGKPDGLAGHKLVVQRSTAAVMPLVLIGIFLERFIVKGLAAGAVK